MRLFTAIPADELAAALEPLLSGCADRAPFIRWLPASRLHLTLRFLGEVAEGDLPAVFGWFEDALVGAPRIRIRAQRTGLFRKKDRVVLFIQLAADPGLQELARRLATPVAGIAPDRQQFLPHLTLARYEVSPSESIPFRAFLDWFGRSRMPDIILPAPRVVLFESALTPAGAVHSPLKTVPLPPP